MVAAGRGRLDTLRRLLKAGADIDARNKKGNSALMVAVLQRRQKAAALLLKAGANPRFRNTNGDTAEDMARGAKLREALGDLPCTVAQAAIRFGLMNPGVSGVLVGFSRPEHIDEAVAAVDMGPLPDDVLQRLDALYASDFGG